MTHCWWPSNIIRLCFFLFIFRCMSLSGIRDVLGKVRQEIEYELLVERVPGIWRKQGRREKKKTVCHIFDR